MMPLLAPDHPTDEGLGDAVFGGKIDLSKAAQSVLSPDFRLLGIREFGQGVGIPRWDATTSHGVSHIVSLITSIQVVRVDALPDIAMVEGVLPLNQGAPEFHLKRQAVSPDRPSRPAASVPGGQPSVSKEKIAGPHPARPQLRAVRLGRPVLVNVLPEAGLRGLRALVPASVRTVRAAVAPRQARLERRAAHLASHGAAVLRALTATDQAIRSGLRHKAGERIAASHARAGNGATLEGHLRVASGGVTPQDGDNIAGAFVRPNFTRLGALA